MDAPLLAYQGDEPYVFVCYAHDDEGVVYPEIAWLHEQGINLWYDFTGREAAASATGRTLW